MARVLDCVAGASWSAQLNGQCHGEDARSGWDGKEAEEIRGARLGVPAGQIVDGVEQPIGGLAMLASRTSAGRDPTVGPGVPVGVLRSTSLAEEQFGEACPVFGGKGESAWRLPAKGQAGHWRRLPLLCPARHPRGYL